MRTVSSNRAAAITPQDARRFLLVAIGLGVLVRLSLATSTPGHPFDIGSFRLVAAELVRDPLGVYAVANPVGTHRWPYPPGYFPWLLAARELDLAGLVSLRVAMPLPAMLADGLLGWLVWVGLGRSGASEERRLVAAMAVVMGPSFLIASVHHGQIDAVAVAPAVAGLLVWEKDVRHRALIAGLLIGAGACIKTAPGLMVLALLPSARSYREAAVLLGTAAAVVAAPLLPFLLSEPAAVARALTYSGVPGMGGLSLLAQPGLAKLYVLAEQFDLRANEVVLFMNREGVLITGPALLAAAAFAWRRRLAPRAAAVLLWLAFLVFQTAFAFQYAVWALPFLLLAGYLRGAVALQAVLLVPALLYYLGPWPADHGLLVVIFVVLMVAAWAGCAVALSVILRRARSPRST